MTIVTEERGTNNNFVPAGIVADYSSNSAPIYGTGILRSVPVIGRELKFHLGINLKAMSKLVQNNANDALDYLKLNDSSRNFSYTFLNFLSIIVESLMLSVLITLEILVFCIPVTLLWLEQLFKVIFPNIKLLR